MLKTSLAIFMAMSSMESGRVLVGGGEGEGLFFGGGECQCEESGISQLCLCCHCTSEPCGYPVKCDKPEAGKKIIPTP